MVQGRFKSLAIGQVDAMKTFWHQNLLISLSVLAVGCSSMSREERLLADGYPPEYVAGVKTGYDSLCAKNVTDPLLWPRLRYSGGLIETELLQGSMFLDSEKIIEGYCKGKSLEVKVEQNPGDRRAYQQGLSDGYEMAIRRVVDEELSQRRQAQAAYDAMKYQMWNDKQFNPQLKLK